MGRFASLAVAGLLGYAGFVRPWHLRWGATPEEARRDMVGDDLLPHPELEATRAVTIAAAPECIWPWIVQMGFGRGGFYAIDLIDNDGTPSADRLVPELQELRVGDTMPTSPVGGFTVAAMDLPRSMVLHVPEMDLGPVRGEVVTAMEAHPVDGSTTRLVARLRAEFGQGVASRLYALLFEPGDFVMMRLMLLGIKERAERTTAADLEALAAARAPLQTP